MATVARRDQTGTTSDIGIYVYTFLLFWFGYYGYGLPRYVLLRPITVEERPVPLVARGKGYCIYTVHSPTPKVNILTKVLFQIFQNSSFRLIYYGRRFCKKSMETKYLD